MGPSLYFVVPCYNDEKVLPCSIPVFEEKLHSLIDDGRASEDSRLLLVNDGSSDGTWDVICTLKEEYPDVIGLDLAANTGEQNALLAGMFFAQERADCVITMDSDLQDDIHAVDEMMLAFSEGKEVVYGVRKDRKSDGWTERFNSRFFYDLMRVCKTGQIRNHSNYRLLSRSAIAVLRTRCPQNYFLPCVASNLSLPSSVVYYSRLPRKVGTSGYTFRRKFRLAMHAVFSHSDAPLRLIGFFAILSFFAFFVCFLIGLVQTVRQALFQPVTFAGCAVFLVSGFLLTAGRIIGEYVFKLFDEIKKEPLFQIKTVLE